MAQRTFTVQFLRKTKAGELQPFTLQVSCDCDESDIDDIRNGLQSTLPALDPPQWRWTCNCRGPRCIERILHAADGSILDRSVHDATCDEARLKSAEWHLSRKREGVESAEYVLHCGCKLDPVIVPSERDSGVFVLETPGAPDTAPGPHPLYKAYWEREEGTTWEALQAWVASDPRKSKGVMFLG